MSNLSQLKQIREDDKLAAAAIAKHGYDSLIGGTYLRECVERVDAVRYIQRRRRESALMEATGRFLKDRWSQLLALAEQGVSRYSVPASVYTDPAYADMFSDEAFEPDDRAATRNKRKAGLRYYINGTYKLVVMRKPLREGGGFRYYVSWE